ncbi:ferredoxin [Candidatus Woesearchaeota archaeon]|nr:ferredoxin [Candidatus Woesearchaeota archaeon]
MAKIEHDREGCIGCGACAAVYPDGWEMSSDGKSDLKDATTRDDGVQEKDEQDPEAVQKHKEAAESCPVSVITVHEDQ